jgi:hypothetical protein
MRVPCRARVYRNGRTERDDGGAKGNRRQGQGLVGGPEESNSLNCLNLCETHRPAEGAQRERGQRQRSAQTRVSSVHRRVCGLSRGGRSSRSVASAHDLFPSIQAGSPRKRVHYKRIERPAPVCQIYLRPGRRILIVEAR